MRTTIKLSLAALALTTSLVACGDARANDTAAQADLKRDLQLASAATMDLASPKVNPSLLNSLETKPIGIPQPVSTVKKGAGDRAVRSQTPTVRATPETDLAATDESDALETLAEAPAPDVSEPVAVAPRPQPVVIQTGGAGDYGTGSDGGVFGSGGGGVVIRGGGVDGDHCERHRRGRSGGGVYFPAPSVPRSTGGVLIGGPRISSGPTSRGTPRSGSSGIGSNGPASSRPMGSRIRGR